MYILVRPAGGLDLRAKNDEGTKSIAIFRCSLPFGLDMQSFVVEVSHQLKAINMPQFILYAVQAENVYQNVLREKCLYEKIRIYLSFLCTGVHCTALYSVPLVSV